MEFEDCCQTSSRAAGDAMMTHVGIPTPYQQRQQDLQNFERIHQFASQWESQKQELAYRQALLGQLQDNRQFQSQMQPLQLQHEQLANQSLQYQVQNQQSNDSPRNFSSGLAESWFASEHRAAVRRTKAQFARPAEPDPDELVGCVCEQDIRLWARRQRGESRNLASRSAIQPDQATLSDFRDRQEYGSSQGSDCGNGKAGCYWLRFRSEHKPNGSHFWG